MSDSLQFKNRRAVVTAAASGIGRATALRLGAQGADLMIIDVEADALAETAMLLEGQGTSSHSVVADCTEPAAVARAFASFDAVDILVNAVGSSARERSADFCDSDPQVWSFVLDVSLVSAMLCTRQVAPSMRDRAFGRIVNISSDAALRPTPKMAEYAAAKSGVLGFTRALAVELGDQGVTINAVCPGLIRTKALEQIPASVLETARKDIPMGRFGEVGDVAGAIAFFASDDAGYITGETLPVNGGRSFC